jgi:uncharacterized membrane protein
MHIIKSQDQLNQAEWEAPDNWSSIYFSKKDNRTFVPKRNPKHGTTINFATRSGAKWIYYLFIIFFLLGGILGAMATTLIMLLI